MEPSEFVFEGFDLWILALDSAKSEVGNVVAQQRVGFLNSSVPRGGEIQGVRSQVYYCSFFFLFLLIFSPFLI